MVLELRVPVAEGRPAQFSDLWTGESRLGAVFFSYVLSFLSTAWLGENLGDPAPAAGYGVVLLEAGVASTVLVKVMIRSQRPDALTQRAVGRDTKGVISVVSYAVAIPLAFVSPWISYASYVGVAAMWVVPDRRVERVLEQEGRLAGENP